MDTAIRSLAVHQERQQGARFRRRAQEALDEMLNRLEAQRTEAGGSPPTLMDLTEAVFQKAFTGDEPQADDMTCVVIKVEG